MRNVLVTLTAVAVVAVGPAAAQTQKLYCWPPQRYRRELVRPVRNRSEIRQLENEALL